ncbi:MAG: DUF4344 domain-containing metallopeptidase [Planktomarina sp.]
MRWWINWILEEDAADVLAAYLITEWHEGAEVRRLGRHVALTFFSDYFSDERSGRDVVWDGVHGPAKQRMYNHLCVMIGSDPDGLSDIGTTFEMERGRLKDCDTEYDAAKFSWGAVIDGLIEGKGEGQLIVTGIDSYMNRFVGQWAQAEIARINSVITFPNDIPVAVIKCGQSNAFYDSKRKEIQMCMEQNFAHRRQFKQFGDRFPIN